ncbi:MAG: glycosyltransferase family 4 protein [Gaiellaceae bacterium]
MTSWVFPDLVGRIVRGLGATSDLVNLIVNVSFDRWVAAVGSRGEDAVVCMTGSALATIRCARREGARAVVIANTPDVATEHRIVAEEEHRLDFAPGRVRSWAAARLASRIDFELAEADLVLANSDFTRQDLIRAGVPPEKVVAIPLGVDLHRFAPHRSAPAPRAREGEAAIVLYVGGVTPRKGVIYLARAVQLLRKRGVRCELHAYGSGQPRYLRALEPYVGDGSLRLYPFVPNADLADIYRSADVFSLPTLSDGFGLVVYEAMACGVPVVVSDRCGAEVEDGVNALVVEHGSAEALAVALERILGQSTLAAALSRAGLETAGAASWERYRQGVSTHVCALLERAAAPVAEVGAEVAR